MLRRSLLIGAPALVLASACSSTAAAPRPAGPARVGADWTRWPPGVTPTVDAQGVPVVHSRGPNATRPPTTGGGLQGNLPDRGSASYVVQDLGRPVAEIGALARFSSGSADGALCLACWDRWPPGDGPAPVPDARCHLVVTPSSWSYGFWRSGEYAVLREGAVDGGLASGEFSVRVRLDARGASVELPGTAVRIEDDRVARGAATHACWEYYKAAPGAADVVFLRTWAA